jgi:predicted DNA binding protein
MKRDKTKELLIEQLKKTPIIQIACEKTQVARASFYRWKNEDKEFSKATEEALLEGETFITEMSESQLISMIRDGNFQAVQLWLRHHHPSYANKVEITGNIKHSDEELTPEQMALVKAALRLASFDKNHGEEK